MTTEKRKWGSTPERDAWRLASKLRRRSRSRWKLMLCRCYDPTNNSFHNYGGRGIVVDDRWHDFETFFQDVGDPLIEGVSLERPDNNASYGPENWCWATARQQAENRRHPTPPKSTITGPSGPMTYRQAADALGVRLRTITARIQYRRSKGQTQLTLDDLKI